MAKNARKAKKKLRPDTGRKASETAMTPAPVASLREFSLGLDDICGAGDFRSLPAELAGHTCRLSLHMDCPAVSRRFVMLTWLGHSRPPTEPPVSNQIHRPAAKCFFVSSLLSGLRLDQPVLSGCEAGFVSLAGKSVGVVIFFVTFFKYSDFLGLNRVESIVASLLTGVSAGLGGLFISLRSWKPVAIFSVGFVDAGDGYFRVSVMESAVSLLAGRDGADDLTGWIGAAGTGANLISGSAAFRREFWL